MWKDLGSIIAEGQDLGRGCPSQKILHFLFQISMFAWFSALLDARGSVISPSNKCFGKRIDKVGRPKNGRSM